MKDMMFSIIDFKPNVPWHDIFQFISELLKIKNKEMS